MIKHRKRTLAAGLALATAFGLVASLSTPADVSGYQLLGGSLGFNQRDYRVYNNFTDAQANNNTTPNALFPGHVGAPLSIWKAGYEWSSVPRAGTGGGDPQQTVLGSGLANFDLSWQGTASQVGGQNANTHSELGGSSGGTLAFMEPGGGIFDGWRIRYYAAWTWQDGPGNNGGSDLQGVATHEIGHSLGLDHSTASGATMQAAISGSGVGARSINTDDQAGVQAVYGTVNTANKCEITGISGSTTVGETLNITGNNFTLANNEVWFPTSGNGGDPLIVTGVTSPDNVSLSVTIPVGAQPGDVLVKKNGSGNGSLSNAWPIDVIDAVPEPPMLQALLPSSGFPGGFTDVVLTGDGFGGTTSVTFGGVAALAFVVDNDSQITATTPPGPSSTSVDVTVTDPDGSSTLNNAYTYTTDPAPDVNSVVPGSGPPTGGTTVSITGSNVLGVTDVTFDGVSGNNLVIVSPTELQVDTPGGIGAIDVTVIGTANDTISAGFDYDDIGGFVNIGPGIGGTLGPPTLTAEGDQTPGSPIGFEVTIGNTPDNAFGIWFWALGTGGSTPFKQGSFYPLPILFQVAFVMPPPGSATFPFVWDPVLPSGTQFTMQWWCSDLTAPAGSGGSNGLRLDIP